MAHCFLVYGAKLAAFFLIAFSLPFLALPAFVLLLFLLLTCLSGLGFLLCLRHLLRLWNPRIEAMMRERAVSTLTEGVKRANASRDGEDGSLWDEGWLRWARAGVDGLRQVRVHQYLEDQIKNLGVLEGATDPALPCGWEDRMSLDGENVCAQDTFSKGVASSMDNEEEDEDYRPGSKQRHVFCMK